MSDLLRSVVEGAARQMLPLFAGSKSLPYGEWLTVLPPVAAQRTAAGAVVNALSICKNTDGDFLDSAHMIVATSPGGLYTYLKRLPTGLWKTGHGRPDLAQASVVVSSVGLPDRVVWPRALVVHPYDSSYRLNAGLSGDGIFLLPNSPDGRVRAVYSPRAVALMTRDGFTASPATRRELDPSRDFMHAR